MKEGKINFFKNFNIDYENNDVLIDNTDGVWNGNLFGEYKKYITPKMFEHELLK